MRYYKIPSNNKTMHYNFDDSNFQFHFYSLRLILIYQKPSNFNPKKFTKSKKIFANEATWKSIVQSNELIFLVIIKRQVILTIIIKRQVIKSSNNNETLITMRNKLYYKRIGRSLKMPRLILASLMIPANIYIIILREQSTATVPACCHRDRIFSRLYSSFTGAFSCPWVERE